MNPYKLFASNVDDAKSKMPIMIYSILFVRGSRYCKLNDGTIYLIIC